MRSAIINVFAQLRCPCQYRLGQVLHFCLNELLVQCYVASSALSLDPLFERELCVIMSILPAVFTSQEASPGFKMQYPPRRPELNSGGAALSASAGSEQEGQEVGNITCFNCGNLGHV